MMGGNLILEAGKDWASALTKFRRAEYVVAALHPCLSTRL